MSLLLNENTPNEQEAINESMKMAYELLCYENNRLLNLPMKDWPKEDAIAFTKVIIKAFCYKMDILRKTEVPMDYNGFDGGF